MVLQLPGISIGLRNKKGKDFIVEMSQNMMGDTYDHPTILVGSPN
jgi:hypothetical protein